MYETMSFISQQRNLGSVPEMMIKFESFLPPGVGRKVVETVDMVQTVSLQLPVD